jgi:hypothetical protein
VQSFASARVSYVAALQTAASVALLTLALSLASAAPGGTLRGDPLSAGASAGLAAIQSLASGALVSPTPQLSSAHALRQGSGSSRSRAAIDVGLRTQWRPVVVRSDDPSRPWLVSRRRELPRNPAGP